MTADGEPLKVAINAYLDRRSDLGEDWHRIADWWLAQPEVKASTTVRDFAVNLATVEAVKKRRTATSAASTWNKAVAFLLELTRSCGHFPTWERGPLSA